VHGSRNTPRCRRDDFVVAVVVVGREEDAVTTAAARSIMMNVRMAWLVVGLWSKDFYDRRLLMKIYGAVLRSSEIFFDGAPGRRGFVSPFFYLWSMAGAVERTSRKQTTNARHFDAPAASPNES
jgi:hypothetical protein